MMQEISSYGPVVCGINSEVLSTYTGGILTPDQQSARINHYVLLYGWGVENGTKYWRAKNSWGPAWG